MCMKLERQHFSAWMQWLTTSRGHEQAKQKYTATIKAVDGVLAASEVCDIIMSCTSAGVDIFGRLSKKVRGGHIQGPAMVKQAWHQESSIVRCSKHPVCCKAVVPCLQHGTGGWSSCHCTWDYCAFHDPSGL
jgi:hypothetical protein